MAVETIGQIRDRARRDAEATLSVYWDAKPMPVDPVTIARDLGIDVFSATLADDDTYGMLRQQDGQITMYIDRRQSPERWRFTCAHEIGHYVDRMSKISPSEDMTFVDRRSDAGRGTASEIYANEFAGALLMPDGEVRWAVSRRENDIVMASRFGVSLQAMRVRRQRLGI